MTDPQAVAAPRTPRTNAGRALAHYWPLHPDPEIAREVMLDGIEAIEAEATAPSEPFDNMTEACRHCPTPDVHPTRIGGILTYEGRCDPDTCEKHDHSEAPSEPLRAALERLRERGFSFYQVPNPCTNPTGLNELDAADFAEELTAALSTSEATPQPESPERDLLRHVLEGAIGATPTGQTDGFTHVFIPSEQEEAPAPSEPLRAALADDPNGEHCNECGQPVWVWWHAPDDLWASVTGRTDGGGLRCIRCFDRVANEQGHLVEWRPIVHDRAALQASPPTAQPESRIFEHGLNHGKMQADSRAVELLRELVRTWPHLHGRRARFGGCDHQVDAIRAARSFLKDSGAVPASGEGAE